MANKKQPSQAYLDLRADTAAWRDIQAASRRLQYAAKHGLTNTPEIQHLRITLAPTGFKFTRSNQITKFQAKTMVKAAREFLYVNSDPAMGKRKSTQISAMIKTKQQQIEEITKAIGSANLTQEDYDQAWKRIYGTGVRNMIKSYGYEAVQEAVIRAASDDKRTITYALIQRAMQERGASSLGRREENQPDYPSWMKDKNLTEDQRKFLVDKRNEYTQANNPEAKKAISDWNKTIRAHFAKPKNPKGKKAITKTGGGLKGTTGRKGRGK
jgi:hypothetical protein